MDLKPALTYTQQVQRIKEHGFIIDSELRAWLYECVGDIEYYAKTQIAYYIAHNLGSESYLDNNIFNNRHNHERYLDKINKSIDENRQTFTTDNSLFSQIYCIYKLYPSCHNWQSKYQILKTLVSKYNAYIELDDIGFPENWEDLITGHI